MNNPASKAVTQSNYGREDELVFVNSPSKGVKFDALRRLLRVYCLEKGHTAIEELNGVTS